MKKLLLLAAFGLFASPAFAQTNISSDVDQSGPSDNQAQVDQAGTNLSSDIDQTSAAPVSGQPDKDLVADVDQDGTDLTSDIDQVGAGGAFAKVDQDGNLDWARIDQNASYYVDQQARIFQTGNGAALNRADIEQQGWGGNQIARIDQIGEDNDARIDQAHFGVTSTVDQDGISHFARVEANALAGERPSFGNRVQSTQSVEQTGSDGIGHSARQRMGVGGTDMDGGNSMRIRQLLGDDNDARQDMTATGAAVDKNNTQIIDQLGGTGNYAFQSTAGNGGPYEGNFARVVQDTCTDCSATQRQFGSFNDARTDQSGSNHVANVTQSQ
ncbi:MAG: hypothetical protein ABJF88_09110 [Rhodothermales bacterium]